MVIQKYEGRDVYTNTSRMWSQRLAIIKGYNTTRVEQGTVAMAVVRGFFKLV
jgi:hypothetical protein